VPGFIGVGAHGWKAQVYQPWGHNSVWGLALPKGEGPGHPWPSAPLSDAVVDCVLKWSFFIFNSFVYLPNV